ncbi:phosphatase PAP2 family protein [Bacillus sp. JJ1521]|uniref:phosphatase PAP2 family protein n=1 Tax=Bacillus sp. JJ1521 TaxID=3122957 RepID=UPI002FFD6232
MKLKSQLSVAFILCLFSLIVFGVLAYYVHGHDIIRFDSRVISLIQGMESVWLTFLMKFLSFIGSAPVIIVLSILILFFLYKALKHRYELILFVGVMVGSPLLNILLKELFKRVRPDFHRLVEISGYSFPSGHAMSALTFYGIITFLLWRHISVKWGRIALLTFSGLMIFGIGMSRIYLGVHYPTDVIGGYFASAVWLGFSIWTFQWFKERRAVRYARLGTG